MKRTLVVCLICFVIGAASIPAFAETMLNNPPNIPSDPHPADGAVDIGLKTHLSWTGGDPDPGDKAVYDLYFGTASEPELLVANLEMPNCYPGVLQNNTQYYWKVVGRDKVKWKRAVLFGRLPRITVIVILLRNLRGKIKQETDIDTNIPRES